MDSKELLTSTRSQFMRAFLGAVRATIPLTKEDLYQKADTSYTSADQTRLLSARNLLAEKNDQVVELLYASMEQLINRSFQTTYNTFHKPSALDASAEHLSLVDANAFEDELRINVVTARFRSEGEEQLRDLNIRIALMFGQDNIKERENPFRPYLFTRCITTAFEGLGVDAEVAATLVAHFSEQFAAAISDLYRAVNRHLAENGVAAQLQLKIQKSPTAPGTAGSGVLPGGDGGAQSFGGGRVEHSGGAAAGGAGGGGGGGAGSGGGAGGAAARPRVGVEQLYAAVRGVASAGGDAAGTAGHGGGKPGWLSGNQAVGSVLRKFFSPQSGPRPGAGAAAHGEPLHYHASADGSSSGSGGLAPLLLQSIRQMQQAHTPATAEMLNPQGEVRNLILEQRGALSAASKDSDEQMTIDVVAMLFEFILRDNQVPAEVRAQLGRLQFIVLKVALRDTSLLTQKGHPARMLVNRIGSISVGLQQIDPSGAHITREICRIVDTLLKDEQEDAALFSRMLDELDAFIALELRVGDKGVEQAIGALEQVQNRALRFAHASAQLGEALHGLTIAPFLKAFLEHHWVNAIEVAGWNDAARALRLRQLVPEVLWSILPKPGLQQRTQLFGMLPKLLKTLREGLALTAMTAAAQQELLDWLVACHTSALRSSGNTVAEPVSLESIQEHFRHFIDPADHATPSAAEVRNAPPNHQLINLAIKALDLEVTMLDQVFEAAFPGQQNGADDLPDPAWTQEQVRQRLRGGVAIEINLGGNNNQGRLNWIDPALSQLVLSLAGMAQPSLISVSMFLRLVRRGQVRFLEAEPLFERAVESLLASADGLDRAA